MTTALPDAARHSSNRVMLFTRSDGPFIYLPELFELRENMAIGVLLYIL